MVKEKLINRKDALLRVPANDLDQVLLPSFDQKAKREVLTTGLPASPGAASGYPVFTADEAVEKSETGLPVILVRRETSPEDIHGMHAAEAILTSTGGSTSHAAVVARGWGKCCVTGASELIIDSRHRDSDHPRQGNHPAGRAQHRRQQWRGHAGRRVQAAAGIHL